MGLPIKSVIVYISRHIEKYGVRDRVNIIASGKLFTPDRSAVALGMGADFVNIARGFMITIGCIKRSNAIPMRALLVLQQQTLKYNEHLLWMRKSIVWQTMSLRCEKDYITLQRQQVLIAQRSFRNNILCLKIYLVVR